jgi:beta-xylosidase
MNGPIQLFVSRDLARWVAASWPGPLVQDAAWATFGQEWAPGVVQLGGQWVLYYATRQTATGAQCITMAVAPAITGPYVNDAAAPLACDAIDPSPVLGADGTPYLTWKADEAGGRQATLVSEALRPDGRTFAPGATPSFLLGADRAWESTVENPDLADVGGHWLLFFSGGDWEDASYATGLATCAGPLGPCADPLDHPVLASTPSVTGPGGASAFRDDRGQWWLAYAAASPGPARDGFGGRLVRSLRVDPLCPGAAPGVDTVVGPSVTPRPLRDPCAATP